MINNGIELLKLAQSGDKIAEEQLIIAIRDKFMYKRIGKYLHKNRQADDEDLKQEFLIGVGNAVQHAKLDIGDPIEYIISRGVYNVRSYLRSSIIKNTTQICMDCGNVTRLNRVDDVYRCKKCGSTNIETREVNEYDEMFLDNVEDKSVIETEVLSKIMMEQFEKTLTPNTNVYLLYELLKDGINRDNPMVKNYIKEIARIWGGCTEQNVVQTLDKLRNRIQKFAHDNGMEIKDGIFIIIETRRK